MMSIAQGLKPLFSGRFTAGLKACSTPSVHWNGETENPCSTLWGNYFQGLKPQVLRPLYAAHSLRSPSPKGEGWGRSSSSEALPQRLKPVLIEPETAGINACSTPARTQQDWELVASTSTGVR